MELNIACACCQSVDDLFFHSDDALRLRFPFTFYTTSDYLLQFVSGGTQSASRSASRRRTDPSMPDWLINNVLNR